LQMQIKIIFLCNFKLIDENLDKIMFDWQLWGLQESSHVLDFIFG
jgi:hypothetical protein